MACFKCYVKLPEGKPPFSHGFPMFPHISIVFLCQSLPEGRWYIHPKRLPCFPVWLHLVARRDIPGADNADSPVGDSADSLATRKRCGTKKKPGSGMCSKDGVEIIDDFCGIEASKQGVSINFKQWRMEDNGCRLSEICGIAQFMAMKTSAIMKSHATNP